MLGVGILAQTYLAGVPQFVPVKGYAVASDVAARASAASDAAASGARASNA